MLFSILFASSTTQPQIPVAPATQPVAPVAPTIMPQNAVTVQLQKAQALITALTTAFQVNNNTVAVNDMQQLTTLLQGANNLQTLLFNTQSAATAFYSAVKSFIAGSNSGPGAQAAQALLIVIAGQQALADITQVVGQATTLGQTVAADGTTVVTFIKQEGKTYCTSCKCCQ